MAYWLMKTEPEVYGIDDLIRDGRNMWEGCRNYTVRNFMRDKMKPGDEALFYHSNSVPSGIIGTMKIVSEGYPDPTQFDPSSEYYDAKSPREAPRWMAIDVDNAVKFDKVLSLAILKEHPGTSSMLVCMRGQRLSVMPVTTEEWLAVLELASQK